MGYGKKYKAGYSNKKKARYNLKGRYRLEGKINIIKMRIYVPTFLIILIISICMYSDNSRRIKCRRKFIYLFNLVSI